MRRLNGSGSLRRSDLIQNNCRAGPRSQLRRPKSRNCGCSAVQLRAQSPAAGNGIFRCRDRAPKTATKMRARHRDQNPGSEWPEIPAETPYSASYRKRAVCGDWMVEALGHKLVTHHPVIEPVSAAEPGTEICDAGTGTQKPAYLVPQGFVSRLTLASLWRASSAETVAAAVQWGQSVIRS
jgi:hypothetical protein